jgi:hypothetical protein
VALRALRHMKKKRPSLCAAQVTALLVATTTAAALPTAAAGGGASSSMRSSSSSTDTSSRLSLLRPPPPAGIPAGFQIAVDGQAWFSSGNVSVTVSGRTFSTSDRSLRPVGAVKSAPGHDVLGAFTESTQEWLAGSTAYTTSSRLYSAGNFVIFEQKFPHGAQGTNITHTKGSSIVSSCFPSIDPQPAGGQDMGFVWWGGRAFLEGSTGGKWDGGNSRDGPGVGTGDGGGPFVVFGDDMSDSLVFSPASNFMVSTPGMSPRPGPVGGSSTSTAAPVIAGYEVFTKSYCTASGDGRNVSFKGEGFTVAACRAKCDSMKCACFDISATNPKSECRCNMQAPRGSANTTKSANGLEAFVFCGDSACGGPAPPPSPPPPTSDGSFCFGLDAPVESVPAGFSMQTIVLLGSGVNSAMQKWGNTMLKMYNTKRPVDYTTQWLGFSTDNGGYYYYNWNQHYLPGISNYQQALEGVHAYAAEQKIPYRHVLLDSWWYTKGDGGGLKEWDATNSTFPDGLKAFALETNWKFQMHNRYWSDNNVYSTENGGKYKFLTEPEPNQMAMPLEQQLWDDLMENKSKAGIPLAVYEQDWLYNEWQGLAGVRASPTLARQWLMQMGTGAAKQNTTVQYCMALSRMVLQSLEIPAVTTFRASDDYHPGQTGYYPTQTNASSPPTDGSTGCTFPYCVYYVGTTSIIADALDLKPSKDNYWSTALQPGSAFNRYPHPTFLNDTHEPYNEMQSAISSYTTAQVAPSDGIGFSNASLIKMACRSDGRLLQPSKPARAIDASFKLSGGPEPRVKNVHAIMATHSLNSGVKWAHVLVIGLNATFQLRPAHIAGELSQNRVQYLLWWGYASSDSVGHKPANVTIRATPFSDAAPLDIPRCGYSDFRLYHMAPIFNQSGFVFLGEVGKWVPISEARVVSVEDASSSLVVKILGEVAELVELVFAKSATTKPISVVCTIGTAGTATATFDGAFTQCTSPSE